MWRTRKPHYARNGCADVSGVVRGAVLLLAVSPGCADFVSADLAAAVAFPDRGHRGGRSAGFGMGDRHFAGASFAAGFGIPRGTGLQYAAEDLPNFSRRGGSSLKNTKKGKKK